MEFKLINNKDFFDGLKVGSCIDSTYFEEIEVDTNKDFNRQPAAKENEASKESLASHKVGIIRFKPFKDLDFIECAFSTRLGGVSTGYSESMSFCYDRGDSRENVLENFRIFSKAIKISPDRLVYSKQTHTTNVLYVDESNAGMGVTKERNYDNIDGLITDKKNLCLVTSFADCVPVIFVDKKRHVIGSAHSGWRGTVGNITRNVVEQMGQKFGTKPEDLVSFIGPSICMDCYEISEDVAEEFKKAYSKEEQKHILLDKKNDHYQLNLHMANYYNMLNAGIKPESINVTNICTCCNKDLLFSHRASKGKRGLLCNFIYIKQ